MPANMKAHLAEYEPKDANQVTELWRSSFQLAMGLTPEDSPGDFDQHVRFLNDQVAIENQLFLMKSAESGQILAFMAISGEWVNHLYVHNEFQGRGLGTRLLNLAKESSDGQLRLFTFKANNKAQRFYEKHGFTVGARGVADMADNPWATDVSQLEDMEYHWQR